MEFVGQNTQRNLKKTTSAGGSSSTYLKHEKLQEVFARLGIEDWQELYTAEDVERCFSPEYA
jgi:hypothetical protein